MMRVALGILLLSAVVCVGRGHHIEGHGQGQEDQETLESSISLVDAANKEFSFRLYRTLKAHPTSQGKNVFFSPLSVSVALAALSVGARGETHQQLFSGLGFNDSVLTQTVVDKAFQTMLDKTNKKSDDSSEGTAVFVDNSFKPKPEFLDVLKQSYFADGFNVDFSQTADSIKTINTYVSEKTNGKIDKMVESLDQSTIMYLLSYIYYKGKWATPFDPKLTKEDQFKVDENTKVPVQMMRMKEEMVDTYYDQMMNTSVLRLPFNSSYSMMLLLPDDMTNLEDAICANRITKWLRWMRSEEYDVFLPKFSIKTEYSLRDMLADMGITDIFSAQADLSGISEGQKLVVSEVVHKATLDVDEAGAEAAAATGIGLMPWSIRFTPELKFDRPFMVLITEDSTQRILFMGKIINPNI
ncbi:alpha-1-antitrypsin-like protein GS55-MS [Aulostomus maculatus]